MVRRYYLGACYCWHIYFKSKYGIEIELNQYSNMFVLNALYPSTFTGTHGPLTYNLSTAGTWRMMNIKHRTSNTMYLQK